MKRWIAFIGIVVILAASFYSWKKRPKLIEIKTEKVKRGSVEDKISASGTLKSYNELRVSAKSGGRISSLRVKEGDVVYRGQLLARLDADELAAQLQQAKAGLAQSVARLEQLKAGSREQEIKQAEAGLSSANASLDEAVKNYERVDSLFKQNYATQQQLDAALSQKKMLESQVRQMQENVNLIKNRTTKYDIRVAQSSVAQSKAQVRLVQAQLRSMNIYAPIAGLVTQVFVKEGEVIPPGAPVAAVADMNALYVETNVDEADIGKVHSGKEASVKLEAYEEKSFTGTVDSIAMQSLDIKERGITFLVKIKMPKADVPLRLGMTAEVEILLRRVDGAILVLQEAVLENGKKSAVFVLEADRLKRVEITTGISDDEYVEVLSGLTKGQEVVLPPLEILQDGMQVKLPDAH